MKTKLPTCPFLFVVLLLLTFMGHTQPTKVVPGVFLYDLMSSNNHKVSRSGNTIALKRGSYQYVFFDIQKGTIVQADKNFPSVSSNHRYLFESRAFPARRNERDQVRWAWATKSAGIRSDTTIRMLVADYYALDMDEKNNFIATRIWYDSSDTHLAGMKGLYKVDRQTGNVLQTLREDTLFTCAERNGCWTPAFYLQKNYLAYAGKSYHQAINILPFGNTNKFTISAHDYHTVEADSLVLFTIGDSTLKFRQLKAFDIRTGEMLAKKIIDRPNHAGQIIESADNKLYILQYDLGLIREESVEKGTFTTTKTWDISSSLGLAKDQSWDLTVLKGPSFFLAPAYMKNGEAGGAPANTAHFMHGANNKITFQVYPFYNRTQQDIAKHEKDTKETKDFLAKIQAEKDSIAHPERYCHRFWNTPKYRRGITVFWGAAYHIMAEYDCKEDQYKLWRPRQLYNGNGHEMQPQYSMVPGGEFRSGDYSTNKYYVTCTECDGDGTYEVTVYTTKTKELPWGYFSGIETKKITTTSTTMTRRCQKCAGNGVELKAR